MTLGGRSSGVSQATPEIIRSDPSSFLAKYLLGRFADCPESGFLTSFGCSLGPLEGGFSPAGIAASVLFWSRAPRSLRLQAARGT
jgi:hypothetical protein